MFDSALRFSFRKSLSERQTAKMHSGSALLFLLLFVPTQTPRDSFQIHYEKAESLRRSGNLAAAELEYKAILAEAYFKLGRVFSAEANYSDSLHTFETAATYRPDSNDLLIELAIAYFHTDQYEKALDPLLKVIAREPGNI